MKKYKILDYIKKRGAATHGATPNEKRLHCTHGAFSENNRNVLSGHYAKPIFPFVAHRLGLSDFIHSVFAVRSYRTSQGEGNRTLNLRIKSPLLYH